MVFCMPEMIYNKEYPLPLRRFLLRIALKYPDNLLCSWLDAFKILGKNTLLVRTALLSKQVRKNEFRNYRKRSSWHLRNKDFQGLTVLIRVRSVLFLIAAYNSSGETSPLPSVIPSRRSLFHSSSGAAGMDIGQRGRSTKISKRKMECLLIVKQNCRKPRAF